MEQHQPTLAITDDTSQRRRLLLVISAIFIIDTAVTIWAIANGAVEANPLYWAFHDVHKGWRGMIDAMGVRITLGTAILYALYRDATVHMLRIILLGYGALICFMTIAHFIIFALGPYAGDRWLLMTQAMKLVTIGYAMAVVVVAAARLMQLVRSVRAYR